MSYYNRNTSNYAPSKIVKTILKTCSRYTVYTVYTKPNDDTTVESIFEMSATLPPAIENLVQKKRKEKNITKKRETKQEYWGDVRCKRTGKNEENVWQKTGEESLIATD